MQLTLQAAPNFRDFGGVATDDGRRVRRGWLYRSDALDTLTDADLAALQPLNVRIVCDLRTARERQHAPSRVPAGWQPDLLTAAENVVAGTGDVARLLQDGRHLDESHAQAFMTATYHAFAAQFAAILRELFERLARGEGPLLVHCAAGKDRTGFTCAMLYQALGVPRATAMADYELSDRFFGAARIARVIEARTGLRPAAGLVDAMRVRAEYLASTFASIEAAYGSIDAYLESRAGLSAELRDALRRQLLEDAAA